MRSFPLVLLLCAASTMPVRAAAQVVGSANDNYRTEQGRASIAKGLSGADRDQRQRPRQLIQAMKIEPGMTVADIGTGTGYMLPYLSGAVGPGGKVLAEDIFDDFLAKARASAAKANLRNVTFVKGDEHSPKLPAASVDVILALDSYHHYDYPQEMLAGFKSALKPGGRLVIVEYFKRPGAMGGGNGALQHIRLDDAGVIREIEAAGFSLIEEHDHIPGSQYMATFRRP